MADIKTRDAVKGTIKAIDKAAIASERMKSAYVGIKEKAEQGYYADENSATEYTADRISYAADRVKDEGIHQFNKQGQKAVKTTQENIGKAKDKMDNKYNRSDEFVFVSRLKGEYKMKANTVKNNVAEQEFNIIVSDVHIPRMVPIQTLSDEIGISYKTIWQWCKQNKIVYVKSGAKYLVNVDKFVEFLNTGEHDTD